MSTKPMSAWTLPELLVVMILSGLIFLTLLDATDLIKRLTLHLTERWEVSGTTLNTFCQLDELVTRADSIYGQNEGLRLFCQDEELAFIRQVDSLLICDYRNRQDTMFHTVKELQLKEDTLFLLLNCKWQEMRCYWKIRKIIWQ